jgi:hypothetical protein
MANDKSDMECEVLNCGKELVMWLMNRFGSFLQNPTHLMQQNQRYSC